MKSNPSPIQLFAREPFRLFFPAATLAGIIGVALWPLHLLGVIPLFPGQSHARLMAHGMFGGFIFGFLGTAMPRMLSARPLRGFEVGPLLLVHVAMVIAYAFSKLQAGNTLFLTLLFGFAVVMATRIRERKDLPPPGFILVGLSLACAISGALLMLVESSEEPDMFRTALQRLLTYQGFILLPILGIGPFILPRFFGLLSPHDFPEAMTPTRPWSAKAALALAAGGLIIGSFLLEAKGSIRLANGLRFSTALVYMLLEMPLRTGPNSGNVFGAAIRISLVGILTGFLAITFFPAYRIGLLHLTFMGGFAVLMFVVATRVLFGHSGNLALLKGRNRWFLIALGLMLCGMAARVSGDVWPNVMDSHFIYGAVLWIAGVLLWAVNALPKALAEDSEK